MKGNTRKRLIFAFLIPIFLLAGSVRPAYASTITFVTSATAAGNGGAPDQAQIAQISVNAGDTVVVTGGAQNGGSVVFSDSESDTPTLVNTKTDNANVFEQMSYFTVATTSTT